MSGHSNHNSATMDSQQQQQEQWQPTSWRERPIKQPVAYPDPTATQKSLAQLRQLPPIVTPTEIWRLRNALAEVAQGKAFLLQGGDCAELFDYCRAEAIDAKVKLLLQMSLVLVWGGEKPVVRIARMAGQYAKPRSSPMEKLPESEGGGEVGSFRGDILNGFPLAERNLDPERLVKAYFHSAATLNYVRAQLGSGFADLHNPMDWGLGHVRDPELAERYTAIVNSISESLRFMRTVGADTAGQLQTVDLYSSHEALLLEYEEALTRTMKHPSNRPSKYASTSNPPTHGHYNTSAHFLWVGDRTRQPDHAHIEYIRGLENPIGIKVGPTTTAGDLTHILSLIDPGKQPGKVTLITRYGANKVSPLLSEHIAAVRESGHLVVWQSDPMHGNTRTTSSGIKTRSFAAIFAELSESMRIHKEMGSFLGGVHLELTGDAVTECTGGSQGLEDEDLAERYLSFCDPRLNEKQALELAFLVAAGLREDGHAKSG